MTAVLRPTSTRRCIVLLSGGLDSMAAAHALQGAGHKVEGIFVDYGQPARLPERRAAAAISSSLGMQVRICDAPGLQPPDAANMPGRNGFLLHAALQATGSFQGLLALGIHAGSPYPDCGPAFLETSQKVFDIYTGGLVSLVAPFIAVDKAAVWDYAVSERLPIDLAYSCEVGLVPSCGTCPSCNDRRRLDAGS